jgi:hypothetical protein
MSEVKQLLQKWAELEPDACENLYGQTIRLHLSDDSSHGIYPLVDDLKIADLALVQWAVQEAIVARGWRFEFRGFSSGLGFQVELRGAPARDTNPAAALLKAYLKALEAAK